MERIVPEHLTGGPANAHPCDLPHRSHGLPWSRLWNSLPTV